MQRFLFVLMSIAILTLVVSACAGNPGQMDVTATQIPGAEAAGSVYPGPQSGPTEQTVLDTPNPGLQPSQAAPSPTASPTSKPVKTELEATDPNKVELASGQVQLVEFFAFW